MIRALGVEPDKSVLKWRLGGSDNSGGIHFLCDRLDVLRWALVDPSPDTIEMLGQLQRCKEVFGLFDEDMSGDVTAEEFADTLAALFGSRPTKYQMQQLADFFGGATQQLAGNATTDEAGAAGQQPGDGVHFVPFTKLL